MQDAFCEVDRKEYARIFCVLEYFFGLKKQIDEAKISRSTLAFVNKIYLIELHKSKYILRESNNSVQYAHIKLEVEALEYLSQKKFRLTPRVIPNLKGDRIVLFNRCYYLLQTFMPGKVLANWDNLTGFSLNKLRNFCLSAGVLSSVVKQFKTKLRVENKPLDYFVFCSTNWLKLRLSQTKKTAGQLLLIRSASKLKTIIKGTQQDFIKSGYANITKQLVHFDLHPGNVNFVGNKVAGIFDFDWIRYDARYTDMAGALAQSCYYYGGRRGGLYRRDFIQAGLAAFRLGFGKSSLLIKQENELVRIALKGCLIFQLMFTYDWYLQNTTSKRHLIAVDHFIKTLIRNNFETLIPS